MRERLGDLLREGRAAVASPIWLPCSNPSHYFHEQKKYNESASG
jgi:hypothetical protein